MTLRAKVTPQHVGTAPDVASDGEAFFVVWERKGEIQGMPVDAAGQPLQKPVGIGAGHDPAIAYGGGRGRYAVVWDGAAGGVAGAFVTQGGVVSPHGGFVVNTPAPMTSDEEPRIAWHSQFLVAWRGGTGRMSTLATRMNIGGSVLDPLPIVVLGAVRAPNGRPSVAGLDEGSLVVVPGDRPGTGAYVHTVVVSSTGSVSAGPAIPIVRVGGQLLNPSVCTGPNPIGIRAKHLDWVVWFEVQTDSCLRCARVDGTGGLLDPQGIDVATGVTQPGRPAVVASDASGALIVWPHSGEVRATRVDARGNVATPGGQVLFSSTIARPRIAGNGSEFLLVWEDGWAVVS